MNCELGDFAVIIRAENPANLGRIVQCIEYVGVRSTRGLDGVSRGACWRLDRPFISFNGKSVQICADRLLKPLRDRPGEDQTLRWAGRPIYHKETL